jgi:hypothetical protein
MPLRPLLSAIADSSGVHIASRSTPAQARQMQRRHQAGELVRVHKGIYVEAGAPGELELRVRSHWQLIAGAVVPGAVVSHLSAVKGGLLDSSWVVLSHPTLGRKRIELPGVSLVLVTGPGPLPGDLALGTTGLYWASRPRWLLENLGKQASRRAGREVVEAHLVEVLAASGEESLNRIRDEAAALAEPLAAAKQSQVLRSIIGALLGTHARGELRTRAGQLLVQGAPVDGERMGRFEILAAALRVAVLPRLVNRTPAGLPRQHFAFVESYFSNYVEGTKFDIEQARDIVMHGRIAPQRPKDSHDVLGVFRLASTSPYRDSPPVAGEDFVAGLTVWHTEMLRMRPEARPGMLKEAANFAGTTEFVKPLHVRGTLMEGSRLALSVPEGLARAIYYAFLVSEVHPFDDGNGRLSRLVMNSELTRVDACRIIVPTLYHPQYVDCARALTRGNDPTGFIQALANMARWCSEFDYENLDRLIAAMRASNAFEESPVQYRLLCANGQAALS